MVLKKPYKFLIEHFRLIHFILAITSVYLILRTSSILTFFNNYLNNTSVIIGYGTKDEYFNLMMNFSLLFLIIGLSIILFIMRMKQKKVKFYIFGITSYIITLIIFFYDKSTISTLETSALSIRDIKLASDLSLIAIILQVAVTSVLFIRGIGFNIKKFNFDEDLKIEIDETDNEEFELNVQFDKNDLRRRRRTRIRNIKTSYRENKFVINIVLFVLIAALSYIIYHFIYITNKSYKMNEYIHPSGYGFAVINSYITSNDYKNNLVTDNSLVIVDVDMGSYSTVDKTFPTERVLLRIGKTYYKPTNNYDDYLVDLGKVYKNNNLTDIFERYLFVFEIPKNLAEKTKYFSYVESEKKEYKIKIKSNLIDRNSKNVTSKLGESFKIDTDSIKNVDFKINSYEIADKIKATYDFCENKNKCYESYTYVTPTLSDNYTKTMMKVTGNINLNEQKYKNFNDLSDFIEKFGSIVYIVNGEELTMNTSIKEVVPNKGEKDGIYYFEIYEDIKDATSIKLVLTIRNYIYEYTLK